jgi:putative oxidoreductase
MTRRFHLAAILLARFGLAAGYISAVVDRFGGWGRPGTPGVVWGDFQRFVAQIEAISFVPSSTAPILAWLVTVLESCLGLSLLVGLRTRTMGLVSGCLLLIFAVATIFSPGGVHTVLTSSVLSAAGASMLLATRADEI